MSDNDLVVQSLIHGEKPPRVVPHTSGVLEFQWLPATTDMLVVCGDVTVGKELWRVGIAADSIDAERLNKMSLDHLLTHIAMCESDPSRVAGKRLDFDTLTPASMGPARELVVSLDGGRTFVPTDLLLSRDLPHLVWIDENNIITHREDGAIVLVTIEARGGGEVEVVAVKELAMEGWVERCNDTLLYIREDTIHIGMMPDSLFAGEATIVMDEGPVQRVLCSSEDKVAIRTEASLYVYSLAGDLLSKRPLGEEVSVWAYDPSRGCVYSIMYGQIVQMPVIGGERPVRIGLEAPPHPTESIEE